MERERNEVYERIPWETLERKGGDRQWWMIAVAGAIVLGALAYSFMSNRSTAVTIEPSAGVVSTVVAEPVATVAPLPIPTPSSPTVVAEADLYAIDPERLLDQATAHAEWFVAEYIGVDGSEESRATLGSLLPAGIPVPAAPESTRVFVEWVRTVSVEETAPLRYRVGVLVRSLVAQGEEAYRRLSPMLATVEITVDDTGSRVVLPPTLSPVTPPSQEPLTLVEVPAEIQQAALASSGGTEVLGGVQESAGGWKVVVVAPGPDGVSRPTTVTVP
ncbi:MAG TPA: hypothetical protein VI980_11845 [Acidimicrobiia bacterium]|nr:hypothetical protein [Acidimicrobiia bacterium]